MNTPPQGTDFALPDFVNAEITNTNNGVEPGTQQVIVKNNTKVYMNGTYTTTASHYYFGDITSYGSVKCFIRTDTLNRLNGWQSRTASNTYDIQGNYTGMTSTTVSGSVIKG
jgi:hypothetical protein